MSMTSCKQKRYTFLLNKTHLPVLQQQKCKCGRILESLKLNYFVKTKFTFEMEITDLAGNYDFALRRTEENYRQVQYWSA